MILSLLLAPRLNIVLKSLSEGRGNGRTLLNIFQNFILLGSGKRLRIIRDFSIPVYLVASYMYMHSS